MRLVALLCCSLSLPALADEAVVAVATNFSTVLQVLEPRFETATGHRMTIASGSTGKLYAQIVNGAPFDVFLAADEARPMLLEESGLGVRGTRFTYATGRLALLAGADGVLGDDLQATLEQATIRKFAIANPRLAPYGAAAQEVLEALGAWDTLEPRLVLGENVGQAYALVATGNADAGLVALSSVLTDKWAATRYREVPADLHAPIRQDAILLRHGADNAAARAAIEYLRRDPAARQRIAALGYGGLE